MTLHLASLLVVPPSLQCLSSPGPPTASERDSAGWFLATGFSIPPVLSSKLDHQRAAFCKDK